MRIKSGIVVASIVVALGGGFLAQGQVREKSSNTPQKPAAAAAAKPAVQETAEEADAKLIRASAEAFTKLYNAHDSKGLAALFAPHAEMIDEDGLVTKERDAIENEFAKVFKEFPQASMEVDVESVRVLATNLGIEEGTSRSRNSPDDSESATSYVAIHVKTDGKWLLACVRDWSAPTSPHSPHDYLERDLSWLIGDWIDESPDADVQTSCTWNDNGNFLMQEFRVNAGGEITMSGTLRIGWNAVAKQFQSWVFDSQGGHSTGSWLKDGDRWVVKMQGATAAGEVASSTNYYRPVDKDTITWGSYDRMIDGERVDDIGEIIVKRRPPPPAK